MSAEPAKKRGRPRKVIEIDAQTSSNTTKKTVTTKAAAKQSQRKKAEPMLEQVMPEIKADPRIQDGAAAKVTRTFRTTKSAKALSKKSTIIEQATAFKEQSIPAKANVSNQTTDESRMTENEQMKNAVDVTTSPSKSSFLDSFLNDKLSESKPIVEDDAMISDRTAFSNLKPSIEEIVSGQGVSNIATFSSAQTSSTGPRPSAIPIREPKAYKHHTIPAFEGQPKVTASPERAFDPAKFATSSFTALKASPTVAQVQPEHDNQRRNPGSSKPTPQTTSTAQSQRVSAPPAPSRPSVIGPARGQVIYRAPLPPSGLEPITDVERAAIMKSTAYKRKLRAWTGLIVALPFAIVSSYMLFNEYRKPPVGLFNKMYNSDVPVKNGREAIPSHDVNPKLT